MSTCILKLETSGHVLTAKLSMHVVITISGQVSGQFSKQSPRQFSFCKASRLPFNECGPSMQSVVVPSGALMSGCEDCRMPSISFFCTATSFSITSYSCSCVHMRGLLVWSADNPAWLINIRLVPTYIAWLQYWIWHWLRLWLKSRSHAWSLVSLLLRSKFIAKTRHLLRLLWYWRLAIFKVLCSIEALWRISPESPRVETRNSWMS